METTYGWLVLAKVSSQNPYHGFPPTPVRSPNSLSTAKRASVQSPSNNHFHRTSRSAMPIPVLPRVRRSPCLLWTHRKTAPHLRSCLHASARVLARSAEHPMYPYTRVL